MNWWAWLIVGSWLLGIIPTWRKASWVVLADASINKRPDGADIGFAIFGGAFLAVIWPVVVPFYIAHSRGWLIGGFVAPPENVRKGLELAERERRIEQLEREVGIR